MFFNEKCCVYNIFSHYFHNKILCGKLLLVLIWSHHLNYFFTHQYQLITIYHLKCNVKVLWKYSVTFFNFGFLFFVLFFLSFFSFFFFFIHTFFLLFFFSLVFSPPHTYTYPYLYLHFCFTFCFSSSWSPKHISNFPSFTFFLSLSHTHKSLSLYLSLSLSLSYTHRSSVENKD